MTIQASLEVKQLLQRLFKDWEAWDQNRSYYLHTLLPELKAHPERGTSRENAIIRELRQVATKEEWDQLEEIAEDLISLQEKLREASQILNRFFNQNDFHAAEMYLAINSGSCIQRLYETKKCIAIGRIWRAITNSLDQFEFEKAELEFIQIKPYLSDSQIAEYQSYVKKQQQALIDKTIAEIREACAKYNYSLAESLYLQIEKSFHRDAFNALIEEAKQRQAVEERARIVTNTVQAIQQLLERYDFAAADEKYAQVKEEYSKETYLKLVQTYKNKQERENFLLLLHGRLEAGEYSAADELFRSSDLIRACLQTHKWLGIMRRHEPRRLDE